MAEKLKANEALNSTSLSEVTGTSIGTNKFGLDMNAISLGAAPLIISIDNTSTANTTYYGWAAAGSASSAAVWKIFREVRTGADSDFTFADSDAEFDNIWDNRASLSYG
jgi:hypothetical protein